jgi:hypothetical protein
MTKTKKLNPLEASLYMLDTAIKDIHNRLPCCGTIDEESRWDMVVSTIKESQKLVSSTMCHLRAIYEEIHGEDAYDREIPFSKEETIGVLESWSRKAHCFDSILETLSMPAQEDYHA